LERSIKNPIISPKKIVKATTFLIFAYPVYILPETDVGLSGLPLFAGGNRPCPCIIGSAEAVPPPYI